MNTRDDNQATSHHVETLPEQRKKHEIEIRDNVNIRVNYTCETNRVESTHRKRVMSVYFKLTDLKMSDATLTKRCQLENQLENKLRPTKGGIRKK